jgi:hypothetical protein
LTKIPLTTFSFTRLEWRSCHCIVTAIFVVRQVNNVLERAHAAWDQDEASVGCNACTLCQVCCSTAQVCAKTNIKRFTFRR